MAGFHPEQEPNSQHIGVSGLHIDGSSRMSALRDDINKRLLLEGYRYTDSEVASRDKKDRRFSYFFGNDANPWAAQISEFDFFEDSTNGTRYESRAEVTFPIFSRAGDSKTKMIAYLRIQPASSFSTESMVKNNPNRQFGRDHHTVTMEFSIGMDEETIRNEMKRIMDQVGGLTDMQNQFTDGELTEEAFYQSFNINISPFNAQSPYNNVPRTKFVLKCIIPVDGLMPWLEAVHFYTPDDIDLWNDSPQNGNEIINQVLNTLNISKEQLQEMMGGLVLNGLSIMDTALNPNKGRSN